MTLVFPPNPNPGDVANGFVFDGDMWAQEWGQDFLTQAQLDAALADIRTNIVNNVYSAGGFVNKFRNGTFDIWQRGAGGWQGAIGVEQYACDGWIINGSGNLVGITRVPGRGPTSYALRLNGQAGVTNAYVQQRIDSATAAPLANEACTMQAQIYNNGAPTFTPMLSTYIPTVADDFIGGAPVDMAPAALQPCPPGVWTRVAYTFPVGAMAANGLMVHLDYGGALNGPGQVSITEADIRVTTGVPLGLNADPPPSELRLWSTEVAMCQRFLLVYDNVVVGYNLNQWVAGQLWFPGRMRGRPTVSGASFPQGGGTFNGMMSDWGCTMQNAEGLWATAPASTLVAFSGVFSAEL